MTTSAKSRHVLISGGTRGLGQAIVDGLLGGDYLVSTFGRRPSPFVEERSASHPDRFCFFMGDAADLEQVSSIVEHATARFGTPYAVVNNAGLAADGVLATVDPEQVARLLSTNVAGALYLTRQALRVMLLGRGGRIINISSIIGQRGYSGLSVYSATKAALDGMTRALARELGERGITVNSIAPGYLETEMTHGLSDQQKVQIVRRTPLGTLGKPQDVTGLVLFLLSDAASFITGQIIAVDGGLSC